MKQLIPARKSAYEWIQHADERYVAARFLCSKGLWSEFARLGVEVVELYLKAYLIHKTGKYPESRDLKNIFELCMEYDDFSKDEGIQKYLINPSHGSATWSKQWEILQYPESPSDIPRPYGYLFDSGPDSTCEVIDYIAHFVRTRIERPGSRVDIIDGLVNGDGSIWRSTNNVTEIRSLFIRDNRYFDESSGEQEIIVDKVADRVADIDIANSFSAISETLTKQERSAWYRFHLGLGISLLVLSLIVLLASIPLDILHDLDWFIVLLAIGGVLLIYWARLELTERHSRRMAFFGSLLFGAGFIIELSLVPDIAASSLRLTAIVFGILGIITGFFLMIMASRFTRIEELFEK